MGKTSLTSYGELVRQNEFLNGLIDSISDILFCKDTEGRFLGCNRAFAERVGLSKDEIIGRTDFDLFPGEEAASYRKDDDTALTQNKPLCIERWISYPDGRRIVSETCKTPYRGSDGRLLGLIGIGRDVTARKKSAEQSQQLASELQQAVAERTYQLVKANKELQQEIEERRRSEEALKDTENRYRALFDRSHDIVYLHDFDGHFIDANPAALELMGYAKEDLPSLNLGDVIGPDPLSLSVVQNTLRELKKTGAQKVRAEVSVKRKNGEYAILETKASVIERDGFPYAIQGIARDVTEQRQSENFMIAQRDLGIALAGTSSLHDALRICLETAIRVSGLDSGGIYITDPATGDFNLTYHMGLSEGFAKSVRHIPANSDRARLAVAGKTVYLKGGHPSILKEPDLMQEGLKSIAVIPICSQNRVVGDMNIASHVLDKIPPHSRSALETIAAQIGMSIMKAKAEETLRESEKKYRTLFETASDALLIVDQETGRILDANAAALGLYGYSREELISMGKTDFSAEPQETWEGTMAISRNVSTCHHRKKDGTVLPVEVSANALRIEDRNTHILSVRDVAERKRAEEELLWKTAFFEAQVEATIDGILVVDDKGKRVLVNRNLLNLWNAPQHIREDENDASLLQYVTEGTAHPDQFIEKIRYLNGHPDETSRDEIEFKDGMVLDRHSSPVLGKDGKYYGRIWTFRDITEHKRVLKELMESQQKLSDIIDFLPDATLVIDKEGRIIAWNRAIEEMTGVPAADMLGKGDYEYALPFHGERRPILIDLVLNPRKELEARYTSVERRDSVLEGEAYIPKLKGRESYLFGVASVLRDSKGNIVGAIESIRDITDRRRTEEKYRSIFENAVMGIFQSTPEGRIISANPAFARILGYDSQEDVLTSLTDMTEQMYVQPERRAELLRTMNEQGIHPEQEVQYFRKDRSTVWVTVTGCAVRDNKGRVICYQGTIQDINDRKLLESRLRQGQKMEAIGTLAGGIAHDFNNILSAVIGYAELALEATGGNDRLRRYIERIYKAAQRAGDLVKQILTFSRQTDEKMRPLRISPIVTEVLKLLRASLPATVEVRQNIQSDPDTVLASPTHIHQILMNLCTNAAHAMRGKKGVLSVVLAPVEIKPGDVLAGHGLIPGMHLRLSVTDTGHGIEPAIIEKIYDPFFTTKKPGEGTGMGLSVVHGLVMSCHGTITVQSEVGKGTEFNVYLPLLIGMEGEKEESVVTRPPGGHERILFVDDDEALVNLGKEMLTGLGYQVTGWTSSLEALEHFRMLPDGFDLVITDMTMPNLTGIELAREMMLARPNLPVILCTGFSEAISPETAKALGLTDFVMKPVVIRQIAAAIRRALDRSE